MRFRRVRRQQVLFCLPTNDDLVDAVRPGDRIEVTGVFRAQAKHVNPKISIVKSVYRTYVDVVHFRRLSGDSAIGTENSDQEEDKGGDNISRGKVIAADSVLSGKMSPERIQEFITLSKSLDIYDKLVDKC